MQIAILGCGSIGRRHARNLRAMGCELLLYDPDPAARDPAAEMLDSLDAVWARRPDAALVCTPPDSHVALADAALEHGCHLFVEKPLAHSLDGVDALCAAAAGRVAMVGCNMRFHPGPDLVRRLVTARACGAPLFARIYSGSYLPAWRPTQDYRHSYSASPVSGGAILDCIHEIDLALWYFGPARLRAAVTLPAASLGLTAEGVAELLLEHAGPVLSSVHLNFVERDYRRGCLVVCADGTIDWEFQGGVRTFDASGALRDEYPLPDGWELNRMYVDEMTHFLECICLGSPPANPLAEARETLRLALQAREAA